ncbi:MAG: PadR family transcriptional regulator [Betaproteobacteria bacterium]|nr:PadR family transcriptional regulator [Betaproteobacteria bacterium]
MSLSFGLLGLLTYQDSTGYDLTKMFEDSLNNFWHAQSSQIYRELKRMEGFGWVSSRSIVQDGRPNKRLYTITDTGRSELAAWLMEAKPEFENYHSAMLMRVFFGSDSRESTLALLKECRKQCQNMLETNFPIVRRNVEEYSTIISGGQDKSKYWAMPLDLGIAKTRAMMEWAERCIAQIEGEMIK